MKYTIIKILIATALGASLYFFSDNSCIALVVGNIVGLYIGSRIAFKLGIDDAPAHLNWMHSMHDFEVLLQTANHELQKYDRLILFNPKKGTFDVVDWPGEHQASTEVDHAE